MAFPCVDGFYLPKQENEFVHIVLDELDAYTQRGNRKSILLFPPLSSRLRYLIHRTTESIPELATFSVGEGWGRSVVVCYSELRGAVKDDSDSDEDLYEEPLKPSASAAKSKRAPVPHSRPKRPDKPLYVPRAAQGRLSLQNSPEGVVLPSPGTCKGTGTPSDCSSSDTWESSRSPSFPRTANSVAESQAGPQDEKCDEEDQMVSHIAAMSLDQKGEDKEEMKEKEISCVFDSPQNEDRSDTGDLTEEITAHLKDVEDVSIEKAHNNYSSFEKVWINMEEFSHVIEIYDFPSLFKTEDLLDAFTEYSDGGMKIKWVDNTHALGVFSSESAALHALSIRHPLLKTRTLSEGSKKSKGKAFRRAEFIQPMKERPKTDSAVARRMVTRALGLQRGGRTLRY